MKFKGKIDLLVTLIFIIFILISFFIFVMFVGLDYNKITQTSEIGRKLTLRVASSWFIFSFLVGILHILSYFIKQKVILFDGLMKFWEDCGCPKSRKTGLFIGFMSLFLGLFALLNNLS